MVLDFCILCFYLFLILSCFFFCCFSFFNPLPTLFDFIWNVAYLQLQRSGLRQLLASSTLLAPPPSDRQPVCVPFFFLVLPLYLICV